MSTHMNKENINPTGDESNQHGIKSYRPAELGIEHFATGADFAAELERTYPACLILVQAGSFLHGFGRTAYAMHILKKYKLRVVGPAASPLLQAGFAVANHKRRLWGILNDFGIPYVVAIGSKAEGFTLYHSDKPHGDQQILMAATVEMVESAIADLVERKKFDAGKVVRLLKSPETASFQFKDKVQELDTTLIQAIAKMPRDLRCVLGENIRVCMFQIVRRTMAYGTARDKESVLLALSADIDQLKHYLTSAKKIGELKKSFDHLAGIAVEIGQLLGGLIAKNKPSAVVA
jgi:hypothetical protein